MDTGRSGATTGGSARTPVIPRGHESLPGVDGEVAAPAPPHAATIAPSRSRSLRMRSLSGRRPNMNNAISAISWSSKRTSHHVLSSSSGGWMTPSPERHHLHRPAPRRAVRADTSLVRPQPGHSTVTTPVALLTRPAQLRVKISSTGSEAHWAASRRLHLWQPGGRARPSRLASDARLRGAP
jgi:hypothetical protein